MVVTLVVVGGFIFALLRIFRKRGDSFNEELAMSSCHLAFLLRWLRKETHLICGAWWLSDTL